MTRSILALLALALVACQTGEVTTDGYRHKFNVVTETRGGAASISEAAVAAVNRAEETAWVAADTFTNEALVDALLSAAERGVDVRVVGDADRAGQDGFVRLVDALPPVEEATGSHADRVSNIVPAYRFGNGPLDYSPEPDVDVSRAGNDSQMTSSFVVVDELYVVGATDGFGAQGIEQIGFDAASEWLGRDFADEFRQMHAGVFATTLNTYNGPLKSDTNNRTFYRTDNARVELYFGPQERLMKQMIDDVYAARASVLVVSDFLTSRPMAEALRYKAEAGFDVTVVLAERSRGLTSSRVAALEGAFAGLDNARIATLDDVDGDAPLHFDVLVVDAEASPIDGRTYRGRAWTSTQAMVADIAFVELSDEETAARPSDAFSDSYAFVVERPTTGVQTGPFDAVYAAALTHTSPE